MSIMTRILNKNNVSLLV